VPHTRFVIAATTARAGRQPHARRPRRLNYRLLRQLSHRTPLSSSTPSFLSRLSAFPFARRGGGWRRTTALGTGEQQVVRKSGCAPPPDREEDVLDGPRQARPEEIEDLTDLIRDIFGFTNYSRGYMVAGMRRSIMDTGRVIVEAGKPVSYIHSQDYPYRIYGSTTHVTSIGCVCTRRIGGRRAMRAPSSPITSRALGPPASG